VEVVATHRSPAAATFMAGDRTHWPERILFSTPNLSEPPSLSLARLLLARVAAAPDRLAEARRPAAGAGAAGAEPGGGSPEKIGGEIAGAGTNDAAGGRLPAGSRTQTLLPFDICEGSDRDENN